jgi:hypothetical protein
VSLARFFWIVAGGDIALALALLLKIATGPVSEYDWLIESLLIGFVVLLGAIMWAVMLRYWPSIDVLLAHGARIDCADHDGKSLRDIVAEMRGRESGDMPPQLAALEARLH